ncbi:hypothetical protein Tco_0133345 [Tanacetum coccineum]
MKEQAYNKDRDQDHKSLMTKAISFDLMKECHNELTSGEIVLGKHLDGIHVTWARFGEEMKAKDMFQLRDHQRGLEVFIHEYPEFPPLIPLFFTL